MKTKHKVGLYFLISIILIFIFIVIFTFIYKVSPWMILYLSIYTSPDPPVPQTTYGEFPFELVYEINGEIITVKDVIVCEFDGFYMSEAGGKQRKWKSYFKETGQELGVFLTEDEDRIVYCYVGSAAFYMDDEKYPEERPLTPRVYDKNKTINTEILSQEELLEIYNIKIISWNFSEPIENTFQ